MFKAKIEADLLRVIRELGYVKSTDTLLSIQENPVFGDYSSNVALQLSKQKHRDSYQNPKEIANAILKALGHPVYLKQIEIAGPGFVNFFIKDEQLAEITNRSVEDVSKNDQLTRYLVEFAQLNTHKEVHIGHLRNITVGESLARMLSFAGHPVFRVDYGSDIGLPVAKALWGVINKKEEFEKIKQSRDLKEKAKFLGEVYAFAHTQYEDNPEVKVEIDGINKQIYSRDEKIKALWEETKSWSLAYFDSLYAQLGTKFDARINESEVDEAGKKIVEQHLGTVFTRDQGAVIFEGKKHGLHNRVFINSNGHPTYEAKELGLTRKEEELFPFDISLHVIDTQQSEFFKVVNKALTLIDKRPEDKKRHVPYGFVSLTTGRMSSRKGNVIAADELVSQVKDAIMISFSGSDKKLSEAEYEKIAVGAIKFYYLKYSLLSDISFDVEKSVSLHGDSGPYVMYVIARINSLINRANSFKHENEEVQPQNKGIAQSGSELEAEERMILRHLEYFGTVTDTAVKELQPNLIPAYLLELAKLFNLFYERCPIVNSPRQKFRLSLSRKVAETLKTGMYLLGIESVDRM